MRFSAFPQSEASRATIIISRVEQTDADCVGAPLRPVRAETEEHDNVVFKRLRHDLHPCLPSPHPILSRVQAMVEERQHIYPVMQLKWIE